MKSVVRTHADLGADLVLAPERWLAAPRDDAGVPLGDLVGERRERMQPLPDLVLDVTHARDGYLDLLAARRASAEPGERSSKKRALANDVVISRLRPYLRQVAFVHPAALDGESALALSTEFYVLSPKAPDDDIAWLVPYFLSAPVQATLAAAQEGGHHPRVPRASLFALRVPDAIVADRAALAAETRAALGALYAAFGAWSRLLSADR